MKEYLILATILVKMFNGNFTQDISDTLFQWLCNFTVYVIVQTLVEEEDGIVKPHSQADTSQVGSAMSSELQLKGIVGPFDLEGETRLIRSTVINWRPDSNDTISREEHKTSGA